MARSILFFSLLFVFHQGFCQQKDFDRFIEELDSYRTIHKSIVHEDSLVQRKNYELKWTKTYGTYGGSPYGYAGKITRANDEADTLPAVIDPAFCTLHWDRYHMRQKLSAIFT